MSSQKKKNTNAVKRSNTAKRLNPKLRKKKTKKKRMKYILILELILILILVPAVFLFFQIEKIKTYHMDYSLIAQNDLDDSNMKNYTNIILFGVDSRSNELEKKTRTDSIMIASIHKKTKKVKLISIYRDTYVQIEGHGYTKLNHAYAYGGPELAISTINKNFDLNIKDFVTVNFSALSNVIDALGGVEIDITEEELKYVNAYTRDVARINGTECVYLQTAGTQTLSGTQATGYCRVRYTSGGDYTRAQRQRTVVNQILKKAKSSNPKTLYSIMNETLPQVYTSLSSTKILGLASNVFFYKMDTDTGFPFDKTTKTINKASVVVPTTLTSNVTQLHETLFNTTGYVPSSTVQTYSNEISQR